MKRLYSRLMIFTLITISTIVILTSLYFVYFRKARINDVFITNLTDTSATVVYLTDLYSPSQINLTDDLEKTIVYYDDRDLEETGINEYKLKENKPFPRLIHSVTFRRLIPNREYTFRFNELSPQEKYTFTTRNTSEGIDTPDPVYGKVITNANKNEIKDGIIILREVNANSEVSEYISTYLNDEGSYSLNIGNLYNKNGLSTYKYNGVDIHEISVYGVINNKIKQTNVNIPTDMDQPVVDIILPSQESNSSFINPLIPVSYAVSCKYLPAEDQADCYKASASLEAKPVDEPVTTKPSRKNNSDSSIETHNIDCSNLPEEERENCQNISNTNTEIPTNTPKATKSSETLPLVKFSKYGRTDRCGICKGNDAVTGGWLNVEDNNCTPIPLDCFQKQSINITPIIKIRPTPPNDGQSWFWCDDCGAYFSASQFKNKHTDSCNVICGTIPTQAPVLTPTISNIATEIPTLVPTTTTIHTTFTITKTPIPTQSKTNTCCVRKGLCQANGAHISDIEECSGGNECCLLNLTNSLNSSISTQQETTIKSDVKIEDKRNNSFINTTCLKDEGCGGMGLVCYKQRCTDRSAEGYVFFSKEYVQSVVQPNIVTPDKIKSDEIDLHSDFNGIRSDVYEALTNFLEDPRVKTYLKDCGTNCKIGLLDGFRTFEEQNQISIDRCGNVNGCEGGAAEGRSEHHSGAALDLYLLPNDTWGKYGDLSPLKPVLEEYGFVQPITTDTPHYIYQGSPVGYNVSTIPVSPEENSSIGFVLLLNKLKHILFPNVYANEKSETYYKAGVYEIESTKGETKSYTLKDDGYLMFYYDNNSNNEYDPLIDKIVPFKQITKIDVKKIEAIKHYDLQIGWNLVSIPLVSTDNNLTASKLLENLNSQGANVTHISTFRSGKFILYSSRQTINGRKLTFGQDFKILPGEGYFLKNYTAKKVDIKGQEMTDSIPIQLEHGWNLIGLFNPKKTKYSGFEVLDQMLKQGINTKTLSKWENSSYKNLVISENEKYGNDYFVYPEAGYWIQNIGEEKEYKPE